MKTLSIAFLLAAIAIGVLGISMRLSIVVRQLGRIAIAVEALQR